MDEMTALLAVVLRWAFKCGLDDFQAATAQSLAWYWSSRNDTQYPASHWARLAVRAVRNGADLAGCGTGQADALSHMLQGAGMGEVIDRSPSPAKLAEHAEIMEMVLGELSEIKQLVIELRVQGLSNQDAAKQVGLTPGRTSQIVREVSDAFRNK